jgi:hypothetical protein
MVLVCLNVLQYVVSQSSVIDISRHNSAPESKTINMDQQHKMLVQYEAAAEWEELMRLRNNAEWNKFVESINHPH